MKNSTKQDYQDYWAKFLLQGVLHNFVTFCNKSIFCNSRQMTKNDICKVFSSLLTFFISRSSHCSQFFLYLMIVKAAFYT